MDYIQTLKLISEQSNARSSSLFFKKFNLEVADPEVVKDKASKKLFPSSWDEYQKVLTLSILKKSWANSVRSLECHIKTLSFKNVNT